MNLINLTVKSKPTRPKKQKKVSVQAYVSAKVKEQIEEYADEDGVSTSHLATRMLLKGLELIKIEESKNEI